MHRKGFYENQCDFRFVRKRFVNQNIGYSKMRKWAYLIFTTSALMGWALLTVIAIDATFFNSKLITGIMVN